MDAFDFIARIRHAGFSVGLMDGNLAIRPASNLSDDQRRWIRAHKPDLVSALKSPGTILDTSQSGNDIGAANDRVIVHVPEFTTASGNRYTFDLDVPRANLPLLRKSLQFRLKNGQGGSLLGSPGTTADELRGILLSKYGSRLASVDGDPVP